MSAETIQAQNQQGVPFSVNPMIKCANKVQVYLSALTRTSVTQTIRYKQTCVHANCTNSSTVSSVDYTSGTVIQGINKLILYNNFFFLCKAKTNFSSQIVITFFHKNFPRMKEIFFTEKLILDFF